MLAKSTFTLILSLYSVLGAAAPIATNLGDPATAIPLKDRAEVYRASTLLPPELTGKTDRQRREEALYWVSTLLRAGADSKKRSVGEPTVEQRENALYWVSTLLAEDPEEKEKRNENPLYWVSTLLREGDE
ncbi:hypothetical protein TruAng_011834 [Truncatella angustata]|nr:hypothetical protein TruAng_011834 [Truncatella angustata]